MLRVVETFSGIGSQAKALKNINAEFEIVNTVEWDVNAIYAYDIIHNGVQDLTEYQKLTKEELVEKLAKYTLSNDGKRLLTINGLKIISEEVLRKILAAIDRTRNLVSITDVKARDLPEDVDLLTYSFPCQDLSVCGSWHGNKTGINRGANNRSGMLWEIERLLKEYVEIGKKVPRFLLMENVSNILSATHRENFKEWENYLESIGYINQIYTLDASNFGIPQKRKRTYMISVYSANEVEIDLIKTFFRNNNLEEIQREKPKELIPLVDFLRVDYTNVIYKDEAEKSNPNYTPSREKIYRENPTIYKENKTTCKVINTITTKQDRNPNSGVIEYESGIVGKSPYRNLTPRECFMLMGFDEADFTKLMENNFQAKKNYKFLSREKLIKMAGNSIVVNVLEVIFEQIIYINGHFQ